MSTFIDLKNMRFGRLTAIKRNGKNARNYALWECLCDCGSTTTVAYSELKKGRTNSCGCIRRERAAILTASHLMSKTGTYRSWLKAKERCFNPKHIAYDKYGGAGISMCREWADSFEAFHSELGPRPTGSSLDRIDNSKGYEPNNCRWSSKKQQSRNSKWPKKLTINGTTKNLTEWGRDYGVQNSTIYNRINALNWTPEKAVTTPARKLKPKSIFLK